LKRTWQAESQAMPTVLQVEVLKVVETLPSKGR
jgi:hypothetical protein